MSEIERKEGTNSVPSARTYVTEDAGLNRIAKEVGARHGYDDAEARFSAFDDFKVSWTRGYTWISFEVSDYMEGAPEDALEDLLEDIFKRIAGDDGAGAERRPVFNEWVMSPEFGRVNRKVYMTRNGFLPAEDGDRLRESAKRLADAGLIDADAENIALAWATRHRDSYVGAGASTMRTVSVSDAMKSPEVPDDVLDYAVYAFASKVKAVSFASGEKWRNERDGILDACPFRREAEAWMDANGYYMDLD